jgi:hypothetical protein
MATAVLEVFPPKASAGISYILISEDFPSSFVGGSIATGRNINEHMRRQYPPPPPEDYGSRRPVF